MLTRHTKYQDLGHDYYDRRHAERAKHRTLQTLERQGYRVILEPVAMTTTFTGHFLRTRSTPHWGEE